MAWPAALRSDQRRAITTTRQTSPIEAVKAVREILGVRLVDAKLIIDHVSLTNDKGITVCHRCRHALDRTEESVCPNCGSANLGCPPE